MAGTKIKTWLDAEMTQEGPTLVVKGSVVLGTGVTPGYTTTYTDNERGDTPVTLYASSRYQIFNSTVASASGQGCNLFSSEIAGFDWSNTTSNQSKTLYLGQYFTITMTLNTPNAAGNRTAGITLTYKNNSATQTLQFNVGNFTGPSYSPSMTGDECCVVLWNVNIGGVQGFAITYGLSPSGTWYSEVQSQVGANQFSFSWFSDNLPDDVKPERPGGNDSTTRPGGFGTFTVSSNDRGSIGGASIIADAAAENAIVMNAITTTGSGGGIHIYHPISADWTRAMWDMGPNPYNIADYADKLFLGTVNQVTGVNPLDAILTYHLVPEDFCTNSTSESIKCAGMSMFYLTQNPDSTYLQNTIQAMTGSTIIKGVNVGSLLLDSHFFDAFQDFAPYTQMILHLPYCGVIEIDVNQCMYGWIDVTYVGNIVTGDCVAYVTLCDQDGHSNYVHCCTGNFRTPLPVFGSNFAREMAVGKQQIINQTAVQGLGALGAMGIGAATGNMAMVAGGAMGMMGAGLNYITKENELKMKPRGIQSTGSLGAGVSALEDNVCFLEIIRPKSLNPEYYENQIGIPSEVGGTMSGLGCSGFTKLRSIDLSSVNATQAEKDEIVKMVTNGIYIQ